MIQLCNAFRLRLRHIPPGTFFVATDYDELRTDVKESQENSLEALKSG